jgi:GNAT superfamily N-acetyltransferase
LSSLELSMTAAANPSSRAWEVRIRAAALYDAEAIARVINAAFVVELVAFDGDRVDVEGVRLLMNGGTFLAAESGNESHGFTGCVYVELRGQRCYLGLLSVTPALQGTGLGRRLVFAAEDHARTAGCLAMDLRMISPRAKALLPFYERLGYTQTGTAPFPSDVPSKVPCHYVLMTKSLV